jgi:hypothetical protein
VGSRQKVTIADDYNRRTHPACGTPPKRGFFDFNFLKITKKFHTEPVEVQNFPTGALTCTVFLTLKTNPTFLIIKGINKL